MRAKCKLEVFLVLKFFLIEKNCFGEKLNNNTFLLGSKNIIALT